MTDYNYIPNVIYDYEFVEKNNSSLLVINHSEEKKSYLKCNQDLLSIVELINGKNSIRDIHKKLTNDNIDIAIDEVNTIIRQGLAKLITAFDYNATSTASYLFLRFTLIKSSTVQKIASKVSFLFKNRTLVFVLFVLNFSFLAYFINTHVVDFTATSYSFAVIGLTMGVSLFLHEFGHAAACVAYGAKPGAIGFGFYLFTPALYADVTDAWRLQRKERVIIDIAGMQMEGFLTSTLILLYLLTNEKVFYYGALTIAFNTIINVNPLLRYDGYWILSDATGVSNLRKKSKESFLKIFSKEKLKRQDYFLSIYALLSYAMIIWFLSYIAQYHFSDLLALPKNIYLLIVGLFSEGGSTIRMSQVVLPMIFYFILFNQVKKYVIKKKE